MLHVGSVSSSRTVRCRQPRNADRLLQSEEGKGKVEGRAWRTGQQVTLAGHEQAGTARRRQARRGAGKAARRWCSLRGLAYGGAEKGAAVGSPRRGSRVVSEC